MLMESGGALTLVGLSGSGKSTVAGILAGRWDWNRVDLDEEIVARAGLSVAEIFETLGENAFRQLERELLLDALRRDRVVLATGGGAPCGDGAMEEILSAGPVIWMRAAPGILARRLGGAEHRPLLPSSNPSDILQRLTDQLDVRGPIYARATGSIDTDTLDPQEVALGIESLLSDTMEGPWRR